MIRVFLLYLLPLLLPTLLYLGWFWIAKRRDKEGLPPLTQGPWVWLIGGGIAFMLCVLAYIAVTDGAEPGTTRQAPIYQDGKIIPGGFK
jgi:drug/metabolite transporter (DMT)-like permease